MLDFFSHPCKCQKYSTPAWRGKKLLKRCGWSRTNLKCVSQQIKWLITNESTARHRSQVGVYHILSTVVQAVTQWPRFSSTVTWPRGADTHMHAHVHTQESFFRFRLQTGHKSLRYSSIQSQHVLYWIFLDVVLLILYILYTINNVYTCVQYILHESGNMFYFINSVFFFAATVLNICDAVGGGVRVQRPGHLRRTTNKIKKQHRTKEIGQIEKTHVFMTRKSMRKEKNFCQSQFF